MESSKSTPTTTTSSNSQYNGFTIPTSGWTVPTIRLQDALSNPGAFWRDYVAARKPVIISGLLSPATGDSSKSLQDLWSDTYLKATAGSESVTAEYRDGTSDRFGRGHKRAPMPFAKFVDLVASGDQLHYLTAQARQHLQRAASTS